MFSFSSKNKIISYLETAQNEVSASTIKSATGIPHSEVYGKLYDLEVSGKIKSRLVAGPDDHFVDSPLGTVRLYSIK